MSLLERLLKVEEMEGESDRLVLIFGFSIAAIICLTILEVFHLLVLGSWNPEIFAAITGLMGNILGIILGRRM